MKSSSRRAAAGGRFLAHALLAGALGLSGCASAGDEPVRATEATAPAPPMTASSPPPPTQRAMVEEAPSAPEPVALPPQGRIDQGGWGYLIEKLVADGVPRERALATFSDPRVPPFDELLFNINPRESRALYRNFLKARSVARAKRCRAEHADAFERAERAEKVPASVVAAILYVETHCGENTGSEVILYRLARLAMANEPQNLERNFDRNATVKGVRNAALEEKTRQRAKYLEDLFYPEVRATFEIADRLQIDPLGIEGSGAGAFGYPQFLPTSYLNHGVDGNGDGRISLYDVDDAAASAARYLAQNGWKPGISYAEKRRVIWHYNRSDAYIDTILSLAKRLEASPAREAAKKSSSLASGR